MVEVSFNTEQLAKKHATKNITSKKWRFFQNVYGEEVGKSKIRRNTTNKQRRIGYGSPHKRKQRGLQNYKHKQDEGGRLVGLWPGSISFSQ